MISASITEPPSPRSLTRTESGISVNWKGRDIIIDKNKLKELELAKMSCRESAAIGTSHAFDILGEYLNAKYVSPFLERVGTCPMVQSGHSLIIQQHSEPTKQGEPQPPPITPVDIGLVESPFQHTCL